MDSNNITQIGDVANNLINKISSAIGWLFTHDTPNRRALNVYIDEIEKSDLPPIQKAAFISRAKKDIKEYANQSQVVNQAILFLSSSAKPEEVEDDWIEQFFDKARLVSDEEFQVIWAKLLAEECNEPGSIPKSLLFILEKMNRDDAEDFMKLCAVTISVFNEVAPLIDSINNDNLEKLGLTFDKIVDLESIGLIKADDGLLGTAYYITNDNYKEKIGKVAYYDHIFELPGSVKKFPVGNVLYTKNGIALYKAASSTERESFWDDVVVPWIEGNINVSKKHK